LEAKGRVVLRAPETGGTTQRAFRTLGTTRGCTRSTRARGACVLAGSPTMREFDERGSSSTSKVETGRCGAVLPGRWTGTDLATIRALPAQTIRACAPVLPSVERERGINPPRDERAQGVSTNKRVARNLCPYPSPAPSGEARARKKAGKNRPSEEAREGWQERKETARET
jgi:hypothetical protein